MAFTFNEDFGDTSGLSNVPPKQQPNNDTSTNGILNLSTLDVPKVMVFPQALEAAVTSPDFNPAFIKISIFETQVGQAIESVVGKKVTTETGQVRSKTEDASTTATVADNIEVDGRGRENYKKTLFIEKIDRHIFLPMPQQLVFNDRLLYEEQRTTLFDDAFSAIAVDQSATGLTSAVLGKLVNKGLRGNGEAAINTGLRNTRLAINSKKEFMFRDVIKRSFTFLYEFAPKSRQEAETLINIIKTLRYHSYPELIEQSSQAGFYIYPANFQIDFYKGSKINTALTKISTCIIENISTDMTPQGTWINLPNGYPPVIRLQFEIRELEALDKRRIVDGF